MILQKVEQIKPQKPIEPQKPIKPRTPVGPQKAVNFALGRIGITEAEEREVTK